MGSQKNQRMLRMIAGTLDSPQTPYALIGAFALNLYGGSRYTADLDIIADQRGREETTARLEKAGFHLSNETAVFTRFESEIDFYGRVECMFVRTREGRDMIDRSARATGPAMGSLPVVQPTDYILLKLMAMANQPGRRAEDEADIRSVLECCRQDRLPVWCAALDRERIEDFSGKFGQELIVEKLFQDVFEPAPPQKMFAL